MVFCLSVLLVSAKLISLYFEEPIEADLVTAKAYAAYVRQLIEEKWHVVYINGVFDIPLVQVDVVIKPDGFVRVERHSVFDPNDQFSWAFKTYRDRVSGALEEVVKRADIKAKYFVEGVSDCWIFYSSRGLCRLL